jgi:hypothetical protein
VLSPRLRLTVSQPVSLGAHDQIFITLWQLRSCFCGAPSLTRGRVCLLFMLLALASAVFLGSESLGIIDHILLSQIWDFPFRRLLRLAGSWWRYSTPPPHGWLGLSPFSSRYITSARTAQKTPLTTAHLLLCACLLRQSRDGYWVTAEQRSCLQIRYLTTAFSAGFQQTCYNT